MAKGNKAESADKLVHLPRWHIQWMDIAALTPYARNPRKNEATIPFLKNCIKRFGFRIPLVVDGAGVVVCGHTRLKAALELGMARLPCVPASDLSDEDIKAFRLVDNKIQEISDWDFEMLSEMLEELKTDLDGNMDDFGFRAFIPTGVDDLFDPENQAQPKPESDGDEDDGPREFAVVCPKCGKQFMQVEED